jgi:hypothetical protein
MRRNSFFIDPMRRFSFQQLHRFGDRHIRPKADQRMHMIGNAIDAIEKYALCRGIVAHMSEHVSPNFIAQQRSFVFGGPHQMNP